MTTIARRTAMLKRTGAAGLVAAVVGGVLCALAYQNSRAFFGPAYLTAFFFWLDITLGCLGLAMLHGLTGGGWGIAIRRVIEAGYQTLPWLAAAFVPLWLNLEQMYPWTDPAYVEHHESVLRKARYLNLEAFQIRAVVYFGVWLVIAALLDASSPRRDTLPDSPRSRRLQQIGGLGFIAYGVTITLASVDWVMSLEPTWYSTMYGVLYMAGDAVSGLSFAVIVVSALGRFAPWSTLVTADRRNDLGNLLLAFVMFWAYVHFMQYLIIWSGNLPEESVWYLRRVDGGWKYVLCGLATFHFAAPFLLLLSRKQKRLALSLGAIATALLVVRYVNVAWLVMPGFGADESHSGPSPPLWLDAAAWCAVGGGWTALFAWRLNARLDEPIYDPLPQDGHDAEHS